MYSAVGNVQDDINEQGFNDTFISCCELSTDDLQE